MIKALLRTYLDRRNGLKIRKRTQDSLAALPNAALKDLGMARSEIASCAVTDAHRRRSRQAPTDR